MLQTNYTELGGFARKIRRRMSIGLRLPDPLFILFIFQLNFYGDRPLPNHRKRRKKPKRPRRETSETLELDGPGKIKPS
jgi:hypothetical protein